MSIFLVIGITAIPILLWGTYFYFKNPRRQPLPEILKIFCLGLFSILPVILFHQYFLDNLTHSLALLLGIEDFSLLISVWKLILTTLFIVAFILIFALIQSTTLKIFYHLSWTQNFKSIYKKAYHLTPLLLFFLLFFGVELGLNLTLKTDFILSLTGSTIIFAVLEEYFKYIINPFLSYKRLNSIGEAVINALYIGLAFAFVENILFFLNTRGEADFLSIFVYRSIFTTLLHVSASGILGYFYGLSLFSKSIVTNYEIEKSQYSTLASLRALLGVRKKSIFQSISVTQGFFIAATIHAVFNLFLYLNFVVVSAILVVSIAIFIIYLLNLENTQVQYGLIGTREMPEEDFEKLRLRISVLQHIRDIQKNNPSISKTPPPS